MSTLLAEQTSNTGSLNYYTNTSRSCQTFTMPAGYDTVEWINILLKNGGSYSGTYYLYLYATSGGLPTGAPLASATVSGGSIAGGSFNWVTFDIADTLVTAGAKYAIVCYANGSSSLSNGVYWGRNTSDSYGGGEAYHSTNSGSSWSSDAGDWAFQVYGKQSANAPTVTSGASSSIQENQFTLAGNVTSDGGATITQRGICYSKDTSDPTIYNSIVIVSGTTGAFTGTPTGLLAGTHYYAKAYATNSQGTSYGAVVEVDTLKAVPTVVNVGYSNLTATSVKFSGNVTDAHGATVTERGFVYGASANPTTANSKATATTGGTGTYDVNVTGLTPASTIHYRAYAINSEGTSYGTDATLVIPDTISAWAQQFTATSAGTLTKISLYARLGLGSSVTPVIRLYSDSSDNPNAVLKTFSVAPITNSAMAWKEYTTSQTLVSGTKYWIVVSDFYLVNNYEVKLGATATGSYAGGLMKYRLTSTGTYTTATGDFAFKVNIQPAMTTSLNTQISYRKRYV